MSSKDTLEWLSKVQVPKKGKVSFEDEEVDVEVGDFKSKSIVPSLKKPNYSGKDLKGLKVAHDLDAFEAGNSEVLVLNDTSVLGGSDGEEDVLVSTNIVEAERIQKYHETAKYAKGYSGFKAYEEEDCPITLGGKPKLLPKYDQFEEDSKASFVIGSKLPVKTKVEVPEDSLKTQFDAVNSAGVEMIKRKSSNNRTDLERERKKAKKLTKALFSDEPEMMAEPEVIAAPLELIEEDDFDVQRIISASRRENLLNKPVPVDISAPPLTITGKSFDAIVEITVEQEPEDVKEVEEAREAEMDAVMEETTPDCMTMIEAPEFINEPLVRNGVAATLELLNMRGISLKPRNIEEEFSYSSRQIGSDIKLEYYDDFGNKLSSKEAYKELSRRFHGKKAGKSRVEKMMKKRELADKVEKAAASESVIVANLRKQQQEAGTPYVLLSATRTQETIAAAPAVTDSSAPKQRKIFGLQVKK